MRLWTFQSIQAINELNEQGKLVVKWERYKHSALERAYRWMRTQMVAKGIEMHGNAPIWTWHSCQAYKKAPTLDDARCLLSDFEIESGIQTIELECPESIVLLSSYAAWNNILDQFLLEEEFTDVSANEMKALFEVSPQHYTESDSIQATLPFLDKKWVVDIRALNLRPNDDNYDPTERV